MTTATPVRLPARRTVVRTAAWTVPIVAVSATAPAHAASCGSDTYAWRLDWEDNLPNDGFTTSYSVVKPNGANTVHIGTATIVGPAGTSPLIVTFRNSVIGSDRRHSTNLTVENTTDIGNLGNQERGLLLWNTNIRAGRDVSRQVLEVSFNRPASGLQFTITDIDTASGEYRDRVELTGDRTGVAVDRPGNAGKYVLGDGREGGETNNATGPWRMYTNNLPVGDSNDNRGNVAVTYNSPVSNFRLDYWNSNGNGQQAIFLSDFTFTATGC